jgi:hypothetical protein
MRGGGVGASQRQLLHCGMRSTGRWTHEQKIESRDNLKRLGGLATAGAPECWSMNRGLREIVSLVLQFSGHPGRH